MALKNANSGTAIQFEDQDTQVTETQVESNVSAENVATASVNAVVATAKAGLPAAASVGKYKPAMENLKGVFDPTSLAWDTFPRITVSLAGFEDEKKVDLGKEIKIQVMSYNPRYVVSPGVQNAESNEKVRFSLDGKFIDGTGESVNDYLEELREEGYKDASVKQYYSIYGMLVASQGKDLPVEDQEIIHLQVPPQSVSKFSRFQINAGVKIAQGLMEESGIVVCRQTKVAGKNAQYAEIEFSAT